MVRAHVDAFNAGDVDALVSGFTDDAVWVTGTTTARGRAALTRLFADAIAGLRPRLAVHGLLADGDRVACEMTETLVAGGEERSYPIAGFYRLRDGRISAAKIYREGSAEVA